MPQDIEANTAGGLRAMADNLYVLGAVGVVLVHCRVDEAYSATLAARAFYAMSVPLFFFLAGLVAAAGEKRHRDDGFRLVARRRATRLLLPFVVLTAAAYLPKAAMGAWAFNPVEGGASAAGLLRAMIYVDPHPMATMWFLPALFIVCLAGWGILRLAGRRRWMVVAAGVVVAVAVARMPYVEVLRLSDALYYLAFYLGGYLAAGYYGVLSRISLRALPPLSASLMCGGVLLVWAGASLYLSGGCLILSFAALSEWLVRRRPGLLRPLRPYTFSIYLLQWFPMVAVRIALAQEPSVPYWAVWTAMFVAGLGVPVLIAAVGRRYLPDRGIGRIGRRVIGL